MTFTDRLFLAKVGSEQMNASLAGGVALQMLTFFFIGLIGYTTIWERVKIIILHVPLFRAS